MHVDGLQIYIDLEPAHTIMAQACLGTLLWPEEHVGDSGSKRSAPLKYTAHHRVDNVQYEKVSSRLWDGMVDLFDSTTLQHEF